MRPQITHKKGFNVTLGNFPNVHLQELFSCQKRKNAVFFVVARVAKKERKERKNQLNSIAQLRKMRFLFLVPSLTMFLSNKTKNILHLRTLFFQANLWTNFFRLFFLLNEENSTTSCSFYKVAVSPKNLALLFISVKEPKKTQKTFQASTAVNTQSQVFLRSLNTQESSFFEIIKYSESKKHQNILSQKKKEKKRKKKQLRSNTIFTKKNYKKQRTKTVASQKLLSV